MGSGTLEIRAGHKAYSGRRVLSGLNLRVEQGHTLAVLGASGSGKSTLLRLLAGLEELDEGELVSGGPGGAGPSIGMVFQRPLLLPWLTVRENVELGLRYKANRAADPGRIPEILGWLGLAEFADSPSDRLSGGQAQRVAIARALAIRPDVLLLDEPFSALDPLTREALQDRLRALIVEMGLTAVLVTHDVAEAIYLGDRIALLDGTGAVGHEWNGAPGDRDSVRAEELRARILGRYESVLPARAGT
ncbi:nitrate ABC transporter ATP-binding protein [Actinomadura sp. NBRC 104425]|uniref:ABC transporter ATP-binding protein n=1 Tax=Actinomadura sp. NBRC 104425 TaxID=3032204 RepID=UPI0024A5E5FD|nr:ABC transporter ATP-binding protein [Actinomadura sp. NBRC 104425]GLZ11678.1 nitrate ABC transporter ATP-binding protein [Actinomadura sp. NBRC 104425]